MSSLWNKGGLKAAEIVDKFTVGNDRVMDLRLAKYDVIGSKAHIKMLLSIDLLTKEEEKVLRSELDKILSEIEGGQFRLEHDVEDIHSQIEILLTRRIGEIGKKIHSGRSRNDQVLVDLKLYFKDEIIAIRDEVVALFDLFQELSERHKEILMPGYTHTQIAMPSSFGLWFGAYAESLIDDLYMLKAAYEIVDQNPLGSAAGYGSSFPIDREMTTKELGFGTLNYNSIAAQLSRGKSERSIAYALSSIALTINKFADDCCSYINSNYNFISFPDDLTTGSSIMPHKKNPDVWELIRAYCNRLQALPNELTLMTTNMTTGYHRDFQLIKEVLFPALDSIHNILDMTCYMLKHISVKENILDDPKYDYIFSVEEVNRRVLAGIPFREAYKSVGKEINSGRFSKNKEINHTHTGSIGNLCNKEIREKMMRVVSYECEITTLRS